MFLAQVDHASMSKFEYLSVLIGVIIGLSVGRQVYFVGKMLTNRRQLTFDISHLILLVVTFIVQVRYWWTLWDHNILEQADFPEYLRMLLVPLLMYAATAMLCPDIDHGDHLHLPDYMMDQSRIFYIIVIICLLAGLSQALFIWQERGPTLIIRGIAITAVALTFWIPNRAVHFALATLLLALVITDVMMTAAME